jgi:hypothetical protein
VHHQTIERRGGLERVLQHEIIADLSRHSEGGGADVALEALVAIGALAPDDPVARQSRDIAAALAAGRATTKLAEPWAALLRRFPKTDGPLGQLPIGAVVDVGGCSIRFDSLSSEESSFSVSLATSPGFPLLHHFPGLELDLAPIEWWAEDDRGNRYLGVSGGGGGSSERAEGTVDFSSPIDPRASALRLMPTADQERAVVTLSLDGLTRPS